MLAGAIGVIAYAFMTTGSRGGLVAAAIAAASALIIMRGSRLRLAGVIAIALIAVGAAITSASDSSIERLREFDTRGSGRVDLWSVAWRMSADHPWAGVGFGNFPVDAPDYISSPGQLQQVEFIVETPTEVHNAYLGLVAENGVIGLALFAVIAIGLVRITLRAAARLEQQGDRDLTMLARAIAVAQIGGLATLSSPKPRQSPALDPARARTGASEPSPTASARGPQDELRAREAARVRRSRPSLPARAPRSPATFARCADTRWSSRRSRWPASAARPCRLLTVRTASYSRRSRRSWSRHFPTPIRRSSPAPAQGGRRSGAGGRNGGEGDRGAGLGGARGATIGGVNAAFVEGAVAVTADPDANVLNVTAKTAEPAAVGRGGRRVRPCGAQIRAEELRPLVRGRSSRPSGTLRWKPTRRSPGPFRISSRRCDRSATAATRRSRSLSPRRSRTPARARETGSPSRWRWWRGSRWGRWSSAADRAARGSPGPRRVRRARGVPAAGTVADPDPGEGRRDPDAMLDLPPRRRRRGTAARAPRASRGHATDRDGALRRRGARLAWRRRRDRERRPRRRPDIDRDRPRAGGREDGRERSAGRPRPLRADPVAPGGEPAPGRAGRGRRPAVDSGRGGGHGLGGSGISVLAAPDGSGEVARLDGTRAGPAPARRRARPLRLGDPRHLAARREPRSADRAGRVRPGCGQLAPGPHARAGAGDRPRSTRGVRTWPDRPGVRSSAAASFECAASRTGFRRRGRALGRGIAAGERPRPPRSRRRFDSSW